MRTIPLFALLILSGIVSGQEFPFDPGFWDIQSKEYSFDNFEGKQSLFIKQGHAELKGMEFFTGSIEYKIYVTHDRGFPGIRFRVIDDMNWEEFYIRPHQSGNPDANQYTPVFNGLAGWQLYYGERYSAPTNYKFDEWNTIRLIIAETRAEVYINDMGVPAVVIPELKHVRQAGKVQVGGGGFAAFHFADLKIEKMSTSLLKSTAQPVEPIPTGSITTWSVSNSFSEERLGQKLVLDKESKANLSWENMAVEDKGYANLARRAKISRNTTTVFAKVIIVSDKNQVRKFSYGFSDKVRVYLNDQLLASGNDEYMTRDYRFLGTVGYYDDVYLNLKKGENELWMALTESFGGWSVMGKFEDMDGLVVK